VPGPLQETRNLELVEDRVSVRLDDTDTAERRIAEGDQPVNVVCPVESPAVRICHRNGPSELVLESHNDRHATECHLGPHHSRRYESAPSPVGNSLPATTGRFPSEKHVGTELVSHREQLPCARHPFKFIFAALIEGNTRSDHKVLDGSRNENLSRRRAITNTRGDMDG